VLLGALDVRVVRPATHWTTGTAYACCAIEVPCWGGSGCRKCAQNRRSDRPLS